MGTLKKALGTYMAWCHVIDLVASAALPPPVIDPPPADQSSPDDDLGGWTSGVFNQDNPMLDSFTIVEHENPDININSWRPSLDAHFAPVVDDIPVVTRHEPQEEPKELSPGSGGNLSTRQEVPFVLAFLGSVGGVLGIFQFFESWAERIGKAINGALDSDPHNGRKPSWVVAIQVGLDTAGLEGSSGNFPQVCLYDAGGQLLGYTDTNIVIQQSKFWKNWNGKNHNKFESPKPEGMPYIQNGGIQAVGVWPAPGRERDLGTQQAPYVVIIKRHYDAICVSGIFVTWPDGSKWAFDGTWARASDQAWYYSHIFDERDSSTPAECFWLDHRGTLDHTQDREEEYVLKEIDRLGVHGPAGIPKDNLPSWLWASDVQQEKGLPKEAELTDGMKKNGVNRQWVPQGLKIFLPAFKASNYRSLSNMTLDDLTGNPAKLNWFTPGVRGFPIPQLGAHNLVLPYLHPNDEWRDPNARLVGLQSWSIQGTVQTPADCMPDFYLDPKGQAVSPADGGRCQYKGRALPWHWCRDPTKHQKRGSQDMGGSPKSITQHFSRSLIIEKVSRRNGTSTVDICGDEKTMGPSFANDLERQFCRMSDKTLWPFCDQSKGLNTDCFDVDAEVLVEGSMGPQKRQAHWDSIEHWTGDGKWKRNLDGDGALIQTLSR